MKKYVIHFLNQFLNLLTSNVFTTLPSYVKIYIINTILHQSRLRICRKKFKVFNQVVC